MQAAGGETQEQAKRLSSPRLHLNTGGSATMAFCCYPERRQCFRRRSIPKNTGVVLSLDNVNTERPHLEAKYLPVILTAACRAIPSRQPRSVA
ncbi:hypothetical protein KCP78_00150 [Salmonella enterica subsp. enterica]|nr:hypothetical protein KCP78_00150 [Salmonella enterica subsp. enterica]